MVASKVGNINEIIKYVNVTNSDIKLKTGFVPKYVNMFEITTGSKTGLTFKKGLNLSITV